MTGTPPLWTAQDLVEATGGAMAAPFAASGVSIDTRTLAPGDLFVALTGENGDGHRFVAEAFARGAAGALVHQDVAAAGPLLRVDDTLAALGRLGGYGRARFAGRVVAVTGSVGKTTTKEMLRCLLSVLGPVHAAVASYNNHWGVPLTLARLPAQAAFCVVEIGMNHAGEIAPLARLARPHVAVITAVEAAHIGYLGSIEAIADEKASILAGLEAGGVAVLPGDSPMFPRLRAVAAVDGVRVLRFGSDPAAEIRLLEATLDAEGSDVTAAMPGAIPGGTVRFRLNAPGRHMAMNALAALAAASAVSGLSLSPPASGPALTRQSAHEPPQLAGRVKPGPDGTQAGGMAPAAAADLTLARALEAFVPLSGRGHRRALALPGGDALLLDESYNANPASMRAALAVLQLQPARRRIAVLGDMLELGAAGPADHAALAPAVAAADLVFACGPLMRHLFDSLPAAQRGGYAAESAALAPLVARAVAPGDAILVKGSLGSRMRCVVDALDAAAAAHDTEAAA